MGYSQSPQAVKFKPFQSYHRFSFTPEVADSDNIAVCVFPTVAKSAFLISALFFYSVKRKVLFPTQLEMENDVLCCTLH